MKMLVLAWLPRIGWALSLVACYCYTRWRSRKGYLRKDLVTVDVDLKPAPLNSSIGRIAAEILQESVKFDAETVVFRNEQDRTLWVEYWKDGRIIELSPNSHWDRFARTPFPAYILRPLMFEMIALAHNSKDYGRHVQSIKDTDKEFKRGDRHWPIDASEEQILDRDRSIRETHDDRRTNVKLEFDLSFFATKEEAESGQKGVNVAFKLL